MPDTNNGATRIHFETEGAGPPLVLQHGFTQSLRRWHMHGYVDALVDTFQLILVDARGHGQSDKPHNPAAYFSPAMAKDVLAVVDALGVVRFRFWGFSMGGRIGFELLTLAPERLTAVVLGGAHPFGREAPASLGSGDDPEASMNAFFASLGVDPDALPVAVRDDVLKNDFRALSAARGAQPSAESGLKDLTMPALIYAGANDVNHDRAQACVDGIDNASFVSLPELDHSAAFRDPALILPQALAVLAPSAG